MSTEHDLAVLVASGLIRLAEMEPDLQYAFRHALLQDAAYNALLKRDRRLLHLAVGQTLETLFPDRREELAATLATHFEEAEELATAVHYHTLAGDTAAARYANQEAIMHYSHALALIPETSFEERFKLTASREKLFNLLGDRPLQLKDVEALVGLGGRVEDHKFLADALGRRANYFIVISDYPSAIVSAQQAIEQAIRASANDAVVMGYIYWGIALWHQAEYVAAHEPLQQALERARQANLPDLVAESLRNLGVVEDYQENFEQAMVYMEQSLEAFRQARDLRGEARALNSLGIIAYNLRRYHEAVGYLEQSMQIKRQFGDRYGISLTLANIAVVAFARADHLAAENYYAESLAISREVRDPEGQSTALMGLGVVLTVLGDYPAALALLGDGLVITREIGDTLGEMDILTSMASAAIPLGQHDDAATFAEQALDLARKLDVSEHECAALTAFGEVRLAQGQIDQAIDLFEQSRALRSDSRPIQELESLARAHLKAGQAERALEYVQPILEEFASYTDDQKQALSIRIYLTIGQVLEAAGDPRSREFLGAAHTLLQTQADLLTDPKRQKKFLGIAENRDLILLWKKRKKSQKKMP